MLPIKPSSESVSKAITDPLFDYRHLGERLGYINFIPQDKSFRDVTYAARIGVRKVHQGLNKGNVWLMPVAGNERLGIESFRVDFQSLMSKDEFVKTITSHYPTLKETLETLAIQDRNLAVAFNRKFAVRKDYVGPLYLEYKGKKIGYSDDGYRYRIHEDYDYLRESLQEFPEIKIV